MIVILVLKLETIELFNETSDKWFNCCNFLINFVIYSYLINLFFIKFDHQCRIFIRSLVKKSYSMQIDSLIKDYVLYLSFGFAKQISQLIIVKKVKLELYSIILHKLKIISPVGILLVCYFYHRTECFGSQSISYHNKSLSHKDVRILFITNDSHCTDSHQSIWNCIIYKQIFDIFCSFTSIYLFLPFILNSLEKNLATYFLSVFLSFFKCFYSQDDFTHLLSPQIIKDRFNIVSIETCKVREIDLRCKDLIQI